MKKCTICKQEKPSELFARNGKQLKTCPECREKGKARRRNCDKTIYYPWALPYCPYEAGDISPVPYGAMYI